MSNIRKIYKHLKYAGLLIDSELWELTEDEFKLMNKPTRKRYKHYREIRKLELFKKPITASE